MNVSELARSLGVHPPQRLLSILPEFGFDIGARAVKVDDRVAEQIKKEWRRIKFVLENREKAEREKQKQLEKELRQSSGVTITIPKILTVRELADRLSMPVNKLILELMKNGILANQNENIDHDTAVIVAEELGFKVALETQASVTPETNEHIQSLDEMLGSDMTTLRSPVIVVMGHVDHGKTTLLDSIRSADVVAGEAGGITQHIGAYQVEWQDPKTKEIKPLTFIDTPGHEAFTVMRSRGAKVADIAILVVAADDGIKPQTLEAINIIKAAKLPHVVAINKIDKPGADPERVRNELSQHGLIPDTWGGDIPMIEISAKKKLNIDKLLDSLLIVADFNQEKIKANPDRAAAGTVIEAKVDKGEGPVVTLLVQTGTLKINDPLVVNGEIYGKVRALKNYRGEMIKEAGPSMPARILGFKIAPRVGDVLDVSKASTAQNVDVKNKRVQQTGAEQQTVSANSNGDDEEKKKVLNIVIKADTLGSLEALIGSLERIKNEEARVKVVGKGLGNIMADDVTLSQTTGAILFGFSVTTTPIAQQMIQDSKVVYEEYRVIYDLIDKVKLELEKMLNPELITTELGNFKVVQIFRTAKTTMVVGGRVESGKLFTDAKVRVKRGGEIIGLGKITKLQSGKQEAKEVPAGSECGVEYNGKLKLEEGDILEAYKEEKKEKKLVLS
jgi:translation initiation factor IF-2